MNSSAAEPGRVLVNRYRLDETIGAGGMGRVWRGTDTLLDRPVAVKELTTPPHLPAHEVEVLRTRMIREARSAAKLSHPTIITVFDVAEEDGRPWIVMELVDGPSLGDVIRDEGAVPIRRAANIGEQMAAGLTEAHGHGIVHRDIKPGNVLIAGNDRAVLTDFGIAHLDGSTHLTSTGLLIGSPSYLAPEIAHGRAATPASDLWALGITLYQAVEGALPFDRPTPMATLTAIVTQDLPETPNAGALRPILEALCEKRPEDRPSISEVRTLLREVRDTEPAAPPVTTMVAPALPADDAPLEPATADQEPEWSPVTGEGTVDRAVGAAESAPPAADATGPARAAAAPPPTARRTRRDRSRTRSLVIMAVALVLVLGAGITTVYVSANRPGEVAAPAGGSATEPSGTEGVDEASVGGGDDGEDEDAADDAETDAESAEEDADDEAEDDWDFLTRHEDSSGFAVDVPEDWDLDRQGHMVYFRNPDGGYLLVDQTDSPNPDAGDDWRDFEPTGSRNFSGYALIGIEDVDDAWADDYVSAADWEFTFRDGDMHAINRGFHTENKGYALFLVSGEDQAVNRALLDRIAESFDPAD
ncbi:serine/threonine-protein kinase [Nocardiopsis sp. MG754419]|uniref:serine/threonine-protein kinase n=1 Tax=Nocardiopsis sp. MG754419 TaxID=2259865 RepID=UPI001BAB391A|nr:serine/threonine-protein kinase [Nocardiopsis sp. MG754419]MBR8744334.1 serine/threonine protein kinase [Nocardiopsis sp. MG754419]